MSDVQSKWTLKCLPFIGNTLDSSYSLYLWNNFLLKNRHAGYRPRNSQKFHQLLRMPNLSRGSCGPSRGLSQRGLWDWLYISETTSVCWSLNTQENHRKSSGPPLPLYHFLPFEGEANFCLMDQRRLIKIPPMFPEAWYGELCLFLNDIQ